MLATYYKANGKEETVDVVLEFADSRGLSFGLVEFSDGTECEAYLEKDRTIVEKRRAAKLPVIALC